MAVVVLATAMVVLFMEEQREKGSAVSLSRANIVEREATPPFAPEVSTWPGEVRDGHPVPVRTVHDVPAPPPTSEVVTRPLDWEVHEPPFDGVPSPVLVASDAFVRRMMDAVADRGAEWAEGMASIEPSRFDRFVAKGVLESGLEAWVQVVGDPGSPGSEEAAIHLRDPESGAFSPEAIDLESRWAETDPEALVRRVRQFDLDLDGTVELVVDEEAHNGTDDWRRAVHWLALDRTLRPRCLLGLHVMEGVWWDGWHGSMEARLRRASPDELIATSWYVPEEGDEAALGYTVLRRAGSEGRYEPVYDVVDTEVPELRDLSISHDDVPREYGFHGIATLGTQHAVDCRADTYWRR